MMEPWPAHTTESRPWSQAVRAGTKADRMVRSIEVSLPPLVSQQSLMVAGSLAGELEQAMHEVTSLDHSHGDDLGALGLILLRTESVASSKIERIHAGIGDYARALHGSKANASAVSMVAATEALRGMIDGASCHREVRLETLTQAHRALMVDDPFEHDQAGRLRTVQNWIGGSDHSPRGAMYVPPPPGMVPSYMQDLVTFANRTDLPTLVQAAIAHAQFESIHPFTDGNGRIGRALTNTILRTRGATTHVVVPIASALVARRAHYFDALDAYRAGQIDPILSAFARGATIAAAESRVTAARLGTVRAEMADAVGSVRGGSAAEKLLAVLPSRPVLSASEAREVTGVSESSLYDAIERLAGAGVLRELTARKRNQVWGAAPILDELEDLSMRIELAAR